MSLEGVALSLIWSNCSVQCPKREEMGDRNADTEEQQCPVDSCTGGEQTACHRVEEAAAKIQGRE